MIELIRLTDEELAELRDAEDRRDDADQLLDRAVEREHGDGALGRIATLQALAHEAERAFDDLLRVYADRHRGDRAVAGIVINYGTGNLELEYLNAWGEKEDAPVGDADEEEEA